MAKDKGSKGSAGTASGTPPAGGGGTGTTTAPPPPTPTTNPAPAVTPPPTPPKKRFWEHFLQETDPNTVYFLRGMGGGIIGTTCRGSTDFNVNRDENRDFSNQPQNFSLLGFSPLIPLATKVRKIPLNYPNSDLVRVMVEKGSTHDPKKPVDGLHIIHRYPIEFKEVEVGSGFPITFQLYVNVELVLPIIAAERGSDVIVELGTFLRAMVQQSARDMNLTNMLGKFSSDQKQANDEINAAIPGFITRILGATVSGQTCQQHCGYKLIGIEVIDLVLPPEVQKIVDAQAETLVLGAQKEQARIQKKIAVIKAKGDAAKKREDLVAAAAGITAIRTAVNGDPNLIRLLIEQTTADAQIRSADALRQRVGDGAIVFHAGSSAPIVTTTLPISNPGTK